MSCQKGNVVRKRPQKHQNTRVFKNDLHDTNVRTKRINQIHIAHVCDKCKAILEWKIKYKKYKLLKSPKCCNKCGEKTVKQPYHTVCQACSEKLSICPKCNVAVTRDNENSDERNHEAENLNERNGTRNLTTERRDLQDQISNDDYNSSDISFSDSENDCIDRISKIVITK